MAEVGETKKGGGWLKRALRPRAQTAEPKLATVDHPVRPKPPWESEGRPKGGEGAGGHRQEAGTTGRGADIPSVAEILGEGGGIEQGVGGAALGGGQGGAKGPESEDERAKRLEDQEAQYSEEREEYAQGKGPARRDAAKAAGMRRIDQLVNDLVKSRAIMGVVMHEDVRRGGSAPDARPPYTLPLVVIVAEKGEEEAAEKIYQDLMSKLPVKERNGGEPSMWIRMMPSDEWEKGPGTRRDAGLQYLGAKGKAKVSKSVEGRWRSMDERRVANITESLRGGRGPSESDLKNMGIERWYERIASAAKDPMPGGLDESVREVRIMGLLQCPVAPRNEGMERQMEKRQEMGLRPRPRGIGRSLGGGMGR